MTKAVHVSTESKQDYATPFELIRRIESRFGVTFILDLAASEENAKAPFHFDVMDDSLSIDWMSALDQRGINYPNRAAFLNPPFKRMDPWMEKCAEQAEKGAKIVSLTLSSLGSNWYRDHVRPHAMSFVLTRRVTFVGQSAPYTKELMISLWGFKMSGLAFWDWKV